MFVCPECGRNYEVRDAFRKHVRQKHPLKLDELVPRKRHPKDTGSHLCGQCDKHFSSQQSLHRHQRDQHCIDGEMSRDPSFKCVKVENTDSCDTDQEIFQTMDDDNEQCLPDDLQTEPAIKEIEIVRTESLKSDRARVWNMNTLSKCVIPECGADGADRRVRLFHFPRAKDRIKQWTRHFKNPREPEYYAYKFICHRHFPSHYFMTSERLYLNRKIALPTIHTLPEDDQYYFLPVENTKERCDDAFPRPVVLADNDNPADSETMSSYNEESVLRNDENEHRAETEDKWQDLPHVCCRLCAYPNNEFKQPIRGWLEMLKEIIPYSVEVDDGLPQHICRTCAQKLYTCCEFRNDFIVAYRRLKAIQRGTPMFWEESDNGAYIREDTSYTVGDVSHSAEDLMHGFEEDASGNVEEHTFLHQEDSHNRIQEDASSSIEDDTSLIQEDSRNRVQDDTSYNVEKDMSLVEEGRHNRVKEDQSHGNNISKVQECTSHIGSSQTAIIAGKSQRVFEANYFNKVTREAWSNTSCFKNTKLENQYQLRYICSICECLFYNKFTLAKHKRDIHNSIITCVFCSKTFKHESKYQLHKLSHTRKYVCDVCGEDLKSYNLLYSHKVLHRSSKYECPKCNKKFQIARYFQSHMNLHNKDQFLVCTTCGKHLKHKHALMVHERIHTGEKPYQCHICGKSFASTGALNPHVARHGEPEFLCSYCGRRFFKVSSYEGHLFLHSRMNEYYECPVCFLSFQTKLRKEKHYQTLCSKKCFCIVCKLTFADFDSMLEHRATEHSDEDILEASKTYRKEKMVYCKICDRGINGKSGLVLHMRRFHGVFEERVVKSKTNKQVS